LNNSWKDENNIGQGSFGEVFKGNLNSRQVAIKRMKVKPQSNQSVSFMKFMKEAKV